jgi:PAS domain S-box-containing protein
VERGARRKYGYLAEEMVGRAAWHILHSPEDLASGRARELLDVALQTGKAEGVFERVRKGGQRFVASVAVTLRRDSAGTPVGFVLISKDITEQKRLEEQVRRKNEELVRVQEANRLKSEFLANMSHELRTPLNGVIGFAELMLSGKTGPLAAVHAEYLGDILTSAKHLLQLINDVLDLAKIEAGKSELRLEAVDLSKLVSEVCDVLRTLVARKRMDLRVEVDPSFTDVVLDPGKFKQVLYKYFSNALKFTPDEGQVAIRLRGQGSEWLRLEVEDTGIGIRAEDFSRLFVEFQQLDASAAKRFPGTGLGLALTKRIVEAQGGEVGVRSEPSRGSTFYAVPHGPATAGHGRTRAHAKAQGRSRHPRHSHRGDHGFRHEGRRAEGAGGGLRRLHVQAHRREVAVGAGREPHRARRRGGAAWPLRERQSLVPRTLVSGPRSANRARARHARRARAEAGQETRIPLRDLRSWRTLRRRGARRAP